MARDFKIELDNVEMINGSDDLLKDTKVTKVTLTGENKLNSLNSTFENCTELTAIEGDVNLDGVSDMTEMTLNTPLDELKVTNPTEENIQTDNSLNQVTNVKIGGTKYAKGGIQDVVGSLEWTAENFTYEDAILDNVYTNSSSIEDNKNITISNTLEQKATSIEITGQTYENLVDGKATENLLDEMSMQQTEGSPTQFTPHMEQPICLEYIEGQTYQNLVDGKGEETLISEYSTVINDFVPNTFKPPQNQPICLESMEGETYQNLIKGKGEYKLTDTFSTTWTESDTSIDNPPAMIEIPEIWGNTVQGFANQLTAQNFVDMIKSTRWGNPSVTGEREVKFSSNAGEYYATGIQDSMNSDPETFCGYTLKPNTTYTFVTYPYGSFNIATPSLFYQEYNSPVKPYRSFTTDDTGRVIIRPVTPFITQGITMKMLLIEGEVDCDNVDFDLDYIQSVGDLYVNGRGEPILDEDGNEQYKLDIRSENINLNRNDIEYVLPYGGYPEVKLDNTAFKPNTTYEIVIKVISNTLDAEFRDYSATYISILSGVYIAIPGVGTTGEFRGLKVCSDDLSRINNYTFRFDTYKSTKGEARVRIAIYERDSLSDTPYIPHKEDKITILMPHQLKKIGSIKKFHQSTGDKMYPACSKLYYDYNAQKFFMKHVPTVEYNILNVLTTMNPFVEFNTRSYNNENYYAIDIYFSTINNKFGVLGTGGTDDICFMVKTTYPLPLLTGREAGMNWGTSNTTKLEGYVFGYVAQYSHGWTFTLIIKESNFGGRTLDNAGVIDFFTTYPTSFVAIKNQNGTVYLETLDSVYDILETKILEKPSLDAYSPKTYITTSTEIQPSQMSITNKKVDFIPLGLQPNKDYTLQLDSVGKEDKPITVNLGGTETTIQPINDTSKHHKVVVRTPNTLTTDNLDLSGEGVVINDVMLFEGNTSVIKQDVDYMDEIQSIGEPFKSRNLFDYTQSELGLLDHTNGNISEDNSWKYTTDFVSVKPNTTYCISQTSGSVFNYKIVEYNSSKVYLKGTNWTSSKGTDINRAYNTFTTSANTYYLRLGWQVSIFEIQLEEDTFPTEFIAFDTVRYKLEIQTYDSTWDKL